MSKMIERTTLIIPEDIDDLPDGYVYGAHQSFPERGQSGYYIIRERDRASCTGILSPESWVEMPTAEEIDAQIANEYQAEHELYERQGLDQYGNDPLDRSADD